MRTEIHSLQNQAAIAARASKESEALRRSGFAGTKHSRASHYLWTFAIKSNLMTNVGGPPWTG